jgi:membrane peptidoglycan carboxypeptidase
LNSYIKLSVHFSHLHIIALLLVVCILNACTNDSPPAPTRTPIKGPIQLYDVHGTLICQLHGQNSQLDCLAKESVERQSAFQFIDYALNELANSLHVSIAHLPSDALNVSTTLDLHLQKQVLQKAKQYIATMTASHHMTNAGVVMLDYHNGAILSFIGSLDNPTADSPFNVVTQQPSQLGSLFKPFVYTTAFEQGISPGEVVYDGPFSMNDPQGAYSPFNSDQKFHGYMSYRSALQNNYNIPVLKTYVKTGFDAVRKNVLALGLKPADIGTEKWYSTALGVRVAPLLDTTVAYATMANGGIHIPPHAIEKISASDGRILYAAKPQKIQALSPQTAFMMTDIMSDEHARTQYLGICSPFELYTTTEGQCKAGNPGMVRPAAVHSSTSERFTNTLAVGYTTDLIVGAWAGNSDFSPMFNGSELDGASHIWHDDMLLAEAGKPIRQFPAPPPGVVKKTVAYPNLTTTDWYRTK